MGRVCQAAEERGYKAMPLADLLTGYNLKTKASQRRARHLVREHRPHVLVIAFPCTAWCAMQNLNPDQDREKKQKRARLKRNRYHYMLLGRKDRGPSPVHSS